MDHQYVAEHYLVEQYLLNEMSPELRAEFEEHFFDCQQCAADVRATAAYLDVARTELERPEFSISVHQAGVTDISAARRRLQRWTPALAFALAASLLVVVYQNAIVFPRMRSEVARLESPEILPTLSLVSGNSRGGGVPSATTSAAHSLLLLVDIPAQDRFDNYTCSLYSPQHELLWTGQIPAREAKDTVSIRVPIDQTNKKTGGIYSLLIKGNPGPDVAASSAAVDIANYSFSLNPGPGR